MDRLKLTLSYNGMAFSGWQSQSGVRTIQDVLEQAVSKINGKTTRVHGAGRTDAGVHALGQVAHFDSHIVRSLDTWRRSLNANLPSELRVLKVERVTTDFHSRFSAIQKVYEYRIWKGRVMSPFLHERAWHIPQDLDLVELKKCSSIFVGEHNFYAFCAKRGNSSDNDTIRRIFKIGIRIHGNDIRLRFIGSGFLYKMVRMISAAIVQTAQGRIAISAWEELLLGSNNIKRSMPRLVAPGYGLYLISVVYE